jgi:hypothetical protein
MERRARFFANWEAACTFSNKAEKLKIPRSLPLCFVWLIAAGSVWGRQISQFAHTEPVGLQNGPLIPKYLGRANH